MVPTIDCYRGGSTQTEIVHNFCCSWQVGGPNSKDASLEERGKRGKVSAFNSFRHSTSAKEMDCAVWGWIIST